MLFRSLLESREWLGLHAFMNCDRTWTKHDLVELGDNAKQHRKDIKSVLNFTITDTMSPVQIAHQLLEQLGVPVKQRYWSVRSEGHEGEKLRVYGVDPTEWAEIQVILDRRRAKRGPIADRSGSPLQMNDYIKSGGDLETEENTYNWEETRQSEEKSSSPSVEMTPLDIGESDRRDVS